MTMLISQQSEKPKTYFIFKKLLLLFMKYLNNLTKKSYFKDQFPFVLTSKGKIWQKRT